ncbi:MAG: Gfo/Idh/MocA family oxidoreductase [Proteobacteria bacterium]|nr:Gfo/Idh/MocA family oxidoreductase [Pseudomonadota bacterium]
MAEFLKLAFVGCGAISQMHLMGIRQGAPRIRVTAAIDTDRSRAESVAAETGAEVFTSLEEGLERGDFDAVDLMLPHDAHEAAALRAFAAGVHVLLEKPDSPTVEACDRILEAASRAGTVFMVAENAQYWPEIGIAKQLLEASAIGEIVTARASFFIPPLPAYYGEAGGAQPWRFDVRTAGGGIAIDTGSHWLRPLRMWLGELDEVVAALGHPLDGMEGESLVRALLRFRSGVVAVFDGLLTRGALGPERLFRITGSRGEITVDGPGRVMLYDEESPRGRQVGETGGYMKSYAGELADFAAAVLDGAPLAAGPEQSLGELRGALAMVRSAETGRWEKVWA